MPPMRGDETIAVTGANGFLGSHCVKALLETTSFRVRAVVRAPIEAKAEHLLSFPDAAERLQVVKGDLLTPNGYDAAFDGAAAIVHTAAVVEVLDSSNPEDRIVKPAVQGTQNVIDAARLAGVSRIVHISSVAAVQSPYGLDESHTYTEADWNEWSTIQTDAYGFAKTAAEVLLQKAVPPATEAGAGVGYFDAVALCPAVILGPCFTKAHTKSSAVLVREVMYNNAMNSYFTTFVDARDVALACVAALRYTLPSALPSATSTDGGRPFERFLLVGDDGPMLTTDLVPRAQRLFPQYKLDASAKYGRVSSYLLTYLLAHKPDVSAKYAPVSS